MIKLFVSFFLSVGISFACGLCTVYSPQTQAAVNVIASDDKIHSVEVTLKLTEEFTLQLQELYDMNANMKLDEFELKTVEKIFNDYAKPKRYFLTIAYDKVIRKETFNKIKVDDFRSYIQNGILHFAYKAQLDYAIYENYFLSIKVDDDEKFFLISLNPKALTYNQQQIEVVADENRVIFPIHKSHVNQEQSLPKIQEETKKEAEEQTSYLALFTKKIKAYLVAVKNGDTFALWSLLMISFIYGIIHAIGPGHGKSLAFTYFSLHKSSALKAFVISQASAFVHIIGAFVLVVVSVFVLESVLNNFVNDSVVILTKVSATMIVLLALYILYQKFKKQECGCASCQTQQPTWSTQNPTDSVLQTKAALQKKQDLYFVLTAGLIPCPGTVILFIYAFILKTYFAVILAAIAISLGMGLVLFATSFLGLGLNKASSYSHTFSKVLNFVAPCVMLLLGILLYLNATNI